MWRCYRYLSNLGSRGTSLPARSRGAEALFRALKYSPGFPRHDFATLAATRDWVHAFSDWYNTVHRRRSIQYVTPQQRLGPRRAQPIR